MYDPLYEVNVVSHGCVVLVLPLFGLISCIVISLMSHFEAVTRTHCNVPNYLPSISAAIGDFAPEKYIWRITVALHSLPRMRSALIYYQYYQRNPAVARGLWFTWWNRINSLLHIIENAALLVITYVSSTENFDVHEAGFIVFMVTSMLYMISTCLLFKRTASAPMTHKEAVSLKWKRILFIINITAFFASVYFYFRHNEYCEPGVYTLFAVCEYVVVLSNIGFHSTLIYDIKEAFLMIAYKRTNYTVYTLFAVCEYAVVLSNIGFHSTFTYDFKEAFLIVGYKIGDISKIV